MPCFSSFKLHPIKLQGQNVNQFQGFLKLHPFKVQGQNVYQFLGYFFPNKNLQIFLEET